MPDPSPDAPKDNWREILGPYLTMGLELAVAVVGMFFIGRGIDSWLGVEPWGMYGGLAFGVIGGFIHFIRRALELGTTEDTLDKHEKT